MEVTQFWAKMPTFQRWSVTSKRNPFLPVFFLSFHLLKCDNKVRYIKYEGKEKEMKVKENKEEQEVIYSNDFYPSLRQFSRLMWTYILWTTFPLHTSIL